MAVLARPTNRGKAIMIPDKYVEIIALALVGGFFCVLIPALMFMRSRATRGLRVLLGTFLVDWTYVRYVNAGHGAQCKRRCRAQYRASYGRRQR
jgi:hypothetical protein